MIENKHCDNVEDVKNEGSSEPQPESEFSNLEIEGSDLEHVAGGVDSSACICSALYAS